MSNSIEPPTLLSRLMTFVFAAALVTVVVLIVTLARMFPLNKTQIFFLTTQPRDNLEITLHDFDLNADNLNDYKIAFIKEYIKARNEIVPNASEMQRKWANSPDGIVRTWSTADVYAEFTQTAMWNAYMNDIPDFEFTCPVEFNQIGPRSENVYAVNFRYFCTNSDGQTTGKDYTIVLRLDQEKTIKWTDRLNNPLGIIVTDYRVEAGGTDPLEFKW